MTCRFNAMKYGPFMIGMLFLSASTLGAQTGTCQRL